jgi:chromosome segregation ATPase
VRQLQASAEAAQAAERSLQHEVEAGGAQTTRLNEELRQKDHRLLSVEARATELAARVEGFEKQARAQNVAVDELRAGKGSADQHCLQLEAKLAVAEHELERRRKVS